MVWAYPRSLVPLLEATAVSSANAPGSELRAAMTAEITSASFMILFVVCEECQLCFACVAMFYDPSEERFMIRTRSQPRFSMDGQS
mmetsp:Transcript_4223/g.9351  ORF Transcript_4223/g.9351 Transcript_4223/m.9351 type:complete len:86 (+) Transcript_4223:860-1117(+)